MNFILTCSFDPNVVILVFHESDFFDNFILCPTKSSKSSWILEDCNFGSTSRSEDNIKWGQGPVIQTTFNLLNKIMCCAVSKACDNYPSSNESRWILEFSLLSQTNLPCCEQLHETYSSKIEDNSNLLSLGCNVQNICIWTGLLLKMCYIFPCSHNSKSN